MDDAAWAFWQWAGRGVGVMFVVVVANVAWTRLARIEAKLDELLSRRGEVMDVLTNVLNEIEDYLDNRADAEGNGPADYRPNTEMKLLKALREAREETGW